MTLRSNLFLMDVAGSCASANNSDFPSSDIHRNELQTVFIKIYDFSAVKNRLHHVSAHKFQRFLLDIVHSLQCYVFACYAIDFGVGGSLLCRPIGRWTQWIDSFLFFVKRISPSPHFGEVENLLFCLIFMLNLIYFMNDPFSLRPMWMRVYETASSPHIWQT